uniref:Uncharacterized protein n=1 Tax=Lactuca sativa TaxID=4236 RepID=A0A9R1VAC3_LACSA|nr:hypothetical protein LSAT_V11C600336680 [Lactuca sativa]
MSSSSSDSTAQEDALFVGSIMTKTVVYFQNRQGQSSCSSPKTRKPQLWTNLEDIYNSLIEDYFADDVVYAEKFRRQLRMRKELFLRRFPYFQWNRGARHIKGFSLIQKCTTTIPITLVYERRYLCKPTIYNVYQLYTVHESNYGFPRMVGSIDCMHWDWALCPNAWHGDHREPTIVLEAIGSHDLWIWHAFFRLAGAKNDINILN